MRVAMVCPYSLSRPGGVQGQAVGLSAALRRRGHDVWLFAPAARQDTGALQGGSETCVVGRPVPLPANGSVAPLALWPRAAARLRRAVARLGVEVAHLHEPFAPVLGYGLLARPIVPLVATFHRAGLGLDYRLLTPVARRLGPRIAVRCAVSEAALETAGQVVAGPFELLFNGVDLSALGRGEVDMTADPDDPPGAVPVLFLGRHERRKGLVVLLEALEQVAEAANTVMWIAGDGPMTAELRRRFPPSPRRRWLGVLSETDKADRLRRAGVLCAPALGGESFGMVVVEGLAAKSVVLASDIPGYRQAGGDAVRPVAPGDPGAWAVAVTEAVAAVRAGTGPAAPAALVAGAEHAAAWSMDHLAACYEERYERAVGPR